MGCINFPCPENLLFACLRILSLLSITMHLFHLLVVLFLLHKTILILLYISLMFYKNCLIIIHVVNFMLLLLLAIMFSNLLVMECLPFIYGIIDWVIHTKVVSLVLKGLCLPTAAVNCRSFCIPCQFGELKQNIFPISVSRTSTPLELIHFNIWGPSPVQSLHFIDDFSRSTLTFPFRLKSEAKSTFITFTELLKNNLILKASVYKQIGEGNIDPLYLI